MTDIEVTYGGPQGVAGASAYLCVAWASDASGSDFTTTFNESLDYIAFKNSSTVIAAPSASDFTGLWKNYKGATGAAGSMAWKGEWTTATLYKVNELVYHAKTGYGQCVYIATSEHTSGASTEPEIGASWDTTWDLYSEGGADGADGEGSGDMLADGTVPMTGALTMTQIATPAEPAASKTAIYPKSTALCYYANGGAEKTIQPKEDYMIAFCLYMGGAVLTTGVYPGLPVPVAGTITAARAISNDSTSGSIAVDLWLEPYADAPPADADSITASAPVTITTATKSEDTTLTGWSTSLAVGDFIVPNIDSVTSLKNVTVYLTVARS